MLALLTAGSGYAHDRSPGVLRVTSLQDGGMEVEWSPSSSQRSLLAPVFEGECVRKGRRLTCPDGDVTVSFPALEQSGDEIWILRENGGAVNMERVLRPDPVALDASVSGTGWLSQGVLHVLFGWDHLLFVVLLVFWMPTRRRLVFAVTGFTLGHTAVLLLSPSLAISLSTAWVEAMIAFSLVFLSAELLSENTQSLSRRYPFVLSALFGLVHGFGFSGALRDWGIGDSFTAILTFNLGVECGQLLIIALVFGIVVAMNRFSWSFRRVLKRATLYGIGGGSVVVGVLRLWT